MEDLQSGSATGDDRSQQTAESLRALRDQASQTLEEHRSRVSEVELRLNEQLQLLADELARERLADEQSAEQAALLEQVQQTLAEKEVEVEEILDQLAAQSLEFESQIAERDEELEQLLELHDEQSQQAETLHEQLNAAQQSLEELRNQECEACAQTRDELDELHQQLNDLQQQLRSTQEQCESQQSELAASQQATSEATEQCEQLKAEFEQSQQACEATVQQNEQAIAKLAEAQQKIEELSHYQQNDEQLEEQRRKFELALADVHKLKRENAELREELLSRPEADDQESPELVSLRSERDALAERVSELENAPNPTNSADGQQELEDLQRRFELAVDDVRRLKQENAELEQKLESASATDAVAPDDGPQDWQTQKARLMAALDAEDQGLVDEPRREERATIEGTISITDRVVAEKDALLSERDAEIAELKSQLDSRPAESNLDELREQLSAEILNDQEAVQTEVQKLQQQQAELDAKLREAELEISVQRATLAREQAALEEKLSSLPVEAGVSAETDEDKPRRRWLSALGIKDEEND